MARTLPIAGIADRFPAFRVAAVVAEDLSIAAERPTVRRYSRLTCSPAGTA